MMSSCIGSQVHVHSWSTQALLLANWTIFVGQEERLQVDKLFPQLGDSLR